MAGTSPAWIVTPRPSVRTSAKRSAKSPAGPLASSPPSPKPTTPRLRPAVAADSQARQAASVPHWRMASGKPAHHDLPGLGDLGSRFGQSLLDRQRVDLPPVQDAVGDRHLGVGHVVVGPDVGPDPGPGRGNRRGCAGGASRHGRAAESQENRRRRRRRPPGPGRRPADPAGRTSGPGLRAAGAPGRLPGGYAVRCASWCRPAVRQHRSTWPARHVVSR